jgi:hypothetical protein
VIVNLLSYLNIFMINSSCFALKFVYGISKTNGIQSRSKESSYEQAASKPPNIFPMSSRILEYSPAGSKPSAYYFPDAAALLWPRVL